MNLCERETAVGESLAKGLEKGSELFMNGFCRERVGERGFQYKACHLMLFDSMVPMVQAHAFPANMFPPPKPDACGIRGCVGSVSLKQANGFHQLSCDVATHHKGWLSKAADGTLSWEFSSRGLKYLKGEVVPVANEKGLASSTDLTPTSAAMCSDKPEIPVAWLMAFLASMTLPLSYPREKEQCHFHLEV